ncbi:hypothetical protein Q31b_01640 [Novipirellula aureliae]|uniref:Uncharacterized protein n=2 Tax=Novipirellula aureliae TaxID=2527966 RepID=A0A5C6E5P3_9BACT|nr:hypothetical protein Q31b_01640 [Novipirellula aureliae]
MDTLTGNLLVASSLVTDPLLSRGVCLLVHDDEDAVIGVMLNRPMQPNPAALMAMLDSVSEMSESGGPDSPPDSKPPQKSTNRFVPTPTPTSKHHKMTPARDQVSPSDFVHFGGPLSGPVVAIHQLSEFAEAETGKGIYVAAQKQHLEGLVKNRPGPYRLIIGHLGWEPSKLADELEAGLWHVVPATAQIVFEDSEQMWPQLIRHATSRSLANWIGIKDYPANPELN